MNNLKDPLLVCPAEDLRVALPGRMGSANIMSSPTKLKTQKRRKRRRAVQLSNKMTVHFVCVSVFLDLKIFCEAVASHVDLGILSDPKLDVDLEWFRVLSTPSSTERFQIFVFNTGCAVFWSCPEEIRNTIVGIMSSVDENQDSMQVEWDDLWFRYGNSRYGGNSKMKVQIKDDVVFLKSSLPESGSESDGEKESDYLGGARVRATKVVKAEWEREIHEKMAISFALAQSIRIGCLEGRVQAKIQENNSLPQMLATAGAINLNKNQIAKRIGSLFQIQAQVNLIGHALNEIPNWFWEQNDQYEEMYLTVIDYLGVSSRIEVLNQQLHVIENLMQFISNQQSELHATSLEWLIIYLIVAEVFLQLVDIVINIVRDEGLFE